MSGSESWGRSKEKHAEASRSSDSASYPSYHYAHPTAPRHSNERKFTTSYHYAHLTTPHHYAYLTTSYHYAHLTTPHHYAHLTTPHHYAYLTTPHYNAYLTAPHYNARLTTHYSLLTTHYSSLTTLYSLSTTHHSLLITLYSLLTTHHSPFTTHYPLLNRSIALHLFHELDALPLHGSHPRDGASLVKSQGVDPFETLREVRLHRERVLTLSEDLEKLVVRKEEEAREGEPLRVEVFVQALRMRRRRTLAACSPCFAILALLTQLTCLHTTYATATAYDTLLLTLPYYLRHSLTLLTLPHYLRHSLTLLTLPYHLRHSLTLLTLPYYLRTHYSPSVFSQGSDSRHSASARALAACKRERRFWSGVLLSLVSSK